MQTRRSFKFLAVPIFAAIVISVPIASASGATQSSSSVAAHASTSTLAASPGALSLVPQEKAQWIPTVNTFPDTALGYLGCGNLGQQLIDEGAGISFQCIYNDPDKGKVTLWIQIY